MATKYATIVVSATHGKLGIVRNAMITSNTINTIKIQFDFRTQDWNGLVKTAIFYNNAATEEKIAVVLDENNECFIPHEMLDEDNKTFYAGVYGVGDSKRLVSNYLKFEIARGSYEIGTASREPTTSVYEQLLSKFIYSAGENIEIDDDNVISAVIPDNVATKDYVNANGGKIDKITVNGIEQPIANKTVDISIVTEETDPTVPAWAKQPNKPTYTAAEVGALSSDISIPTKTSQLENDSNYLTQHQDISGKVDKVTGKQLSTEDYTTAEKTKLASLTNYDDSEIQSALSGKADKSEIPTVPTDDIAANTSARHTHENGDVLDEITSEKITSWDNKQDKFFEITINYSDTLGGSTWSSDKTYEELKNYNGYYSINGYLWIKTKDETDSFTIKSVDFIEGERTILSDGRVGISQPAEGTTPKYVSNKLIWELPDLKVVEKLSDVEYGYKIVYVNQISSPGDIFIIKDENNVVIDNTTIHGPYIFIFGTMSHGYVTATFFDANYTRYYGNWILFRNEFNLTRINQQYDDTELKELINNKADISDIPDVPTEDITANTAARHTHSNATVLAGISADKVTSWDGKQDKTVYVSMHYDIGTGAVTSEHAPAQIRDMLVDNPVVVNLDIGGGITIPLPLVVESPSILIFTSFLAAEIYDLRGYINDGNWAITVSDILSYDVLSYGTYDNAEEYDDGTIGKAIRNINTNKITQPTTEGTSGQVLGLDENLNPVWLNQKSTLDDFSESLAFAQELGVCGTPILLNGDALSIKNNNNEEEVILL